MLNMSPYLEPQSLGHAVSINEIRLKCFNLANIFYANQKLVEEIAESIEEMNAEEEGFNIKEYQEPYLQKIHYSESFSQISKDLLNICFNFRIFDDQMKQEDNKGYLEVMNKINKNIQCYLNSDDSTPLSLREACNKVIHCKTIRPLYDRLPYYDDFFSLTGEIELSGDYRNAEWHVVLIVQDFIEDILCAIEMPYA